MTLGQPADFGAIVLFHYGSIGIYYSPAHEKTYLIPKSASEFLDEGKFDPDAFIAANAPPTSDGGFDPDAFIAQSKPSPAQPKPTPQKRISADEFNKIPYAARANATNVPHEWVIVGFPRIGPYPYLESPLIHDVRMPLFVLAVFYAGLFFILGPTASKNRPPAP